MWSIAFSRNYTYEQIPKRGGESHIYLATSYHGADLLETLLTSKILIIPFLQKWKVLCMSIENYIHTAEIHI